MDSPALCPVTSYPSTTKDGVRTLHDILGLRSSQSPRFADVVLISIDFEDTAAIQFEFSDDLKCEVGLAILDTTQLQHTAPVDAIHTHNFVTGPSPYAQRATGRFLFGETRSIRPSEIVACIQSCIPAHRNVVIVGHGVCSDIQVLQALNFHFAVPPVVLDTYQIAKTLTAEGMSLSRLLEALDLPFHQLHCAGNDAHFTLRALLLLAVAGCTVQAQTRHHQRVESLRQVATYPIPRPAQLDRMCPKLPPKKRLGMSKRRKLEAMTWTAEKKDQIRAARRKKKEENEAFESLFADFDVDIMEPSNRNYGATITSLKGLLVVAFVLLFGCWAHGYRKSQLRRQKHQPTYVRSIGRGNESDLAMSYSVDEDAEASHVVDLYQSIKGAADREDMKYEIEPIAKYSGPKKGWYTVTLSLEEVLNDQAGLGAGLRSQYAVCMDAGAPR